MKTFLITVTLVAFTASEPPPSKSYLPPPATRSSGYPKGPQGNSPFNAGVPEVVAARALGGHGQENHGNGFARNNLRNQEDISRFSSNGEHNEQNGFGRSAIEDSSTVSYQADVRGFKPRVSYQDTEEITLTSGYDSSVSNVRSSTDNYDNEFGHNHGNKFGRTHNNEFGRTHDNEFGRNHATRSNGY